MIVSVQIVEDFNFIVKQKLIFSSDNQFNKIHSGTSNQGKVDLFTSFLRSYSSPTLHLTFGCFPQ